LIIVLIKGSTAKVHTRKHLSLLLAILLVVTVTSQAAAAYVMTCQGTASCCCNAPTPEMGMNGVMPGGMDQNCCDTTTPEPCDIETAARAGTVPFLSVSVTGSVDSVMAVGLTATIVDPADDALNLVRHSENFTGRDGPPIYLHTQHFLC
jgi:hypothetical protein